MILEKTAGDVAAVVNFERFACLAGDVYLDEWVAGFRIVRQLADRTWGDEDVALAVEQRPS